MSNNIEIRRQMIIAFYEIPGIGWHAVNKAVENRLWSKPSWTEEELRGIGLRKDQVQAVVERFRDRPWLMTEHHSAAIAERGVNVITRDDPLYPPILEEIAQPPWVLYARGRLELLKRPAVAIVGTRVPTAYGRNTAAIMAQELSAAGLTVVSGLARGIDSKAHEAALYGAGGTIAVLPTPIDTCYPQENESLYNRISEYGLLLSETPLGTPLHPGQFHQRNRVIAALSRGTIVIEGAKKSGSLITAHHAFDMNREVFAVPGPISSPKSEGPNDLIQSNTAVLMNSINQIFNELPWLQAEIDAAGHMDKSESKAVEAFQTQEKLSADEEKLIALLRDQPLSINELHELSALPFGHLNSLLLNLCIKRKIELQPGSIYIVL